jgi:hypothetical protein
VHKDLAEIDKALIEGIAVREIEKRFSVGRASVSRHKRNHIAAERFEAIEAQIESIQRSDEPVVEQVKDVCALLRKLVARAQQSGNLSIANQGLKNLTAALETLARMTGELEQPTTNIFNFAMCDQFRRAAEARRAQTIEVQAIPAELPKEIQ